MAEEKKNEFPVNSEKPEEAKDDKRYLLVM